MNWQGFKQDDDGASGWNLQQTRTANPVNEITDITNSVGAAWIDPGYDNAGNMTTMPRPLTPTSSYLNKYDAWNRLTKVTTATPVTVVEYAYDGLNRRTRKLAVGNTRHCYYNDQWQAVEERLDSETVAEQQFVWGQRIIRLSPFL